MSTSKSVVSGAPTAPNIVSPEIGISPTAIGVPRAGYATGRSKEPLLSQRVFVLSQIMPMVILATVTFYEVVAHLVFDSATSPILFSVETIGFGMFGSGITWAILSWVAREIAKRERAEGEADAMNAMMQEMHHRIKNNLQTVADLLSLEMSRNPNTEVHASLRDSITRIKSIAASHEMLSVESVGSTNITELAQLVCAQTRRSMVRSDQQIDIHVQGPEIYLASKQATAFALVLNELVSNAIEHGFRERTQGEIEVELDWDGADVWVRVQDDGAGLLPAFDLTTSRGLGLQITRTLVEKDLRGKFSLTTNEENGTTAWVLFKRSGAPANGG
jgi:two-component sensor histidine kinase